jgi:nitroreductase
MEFYDVLDKRCSCRAYEEKAVEPEKLQHILNTVQSAPSAGNLQAFRVYVVRDKDKKEGLARAALDQDFIAQAPVALVFCADKGTSEMKYGERGMELYALQDATIAAAYAQLAATAEGLATVWVGAFEPLEVSYLIDADSHEVPVAILPLGYRVDTPEPRERRPVQELVKEV